MGSKVLDLVHWNRLVLRSAGVWGCVSLYCQQRTSEHLTIGYVRNAPISTLPAETVRLGSIWRQQWQILYTYHHGKIRVVVRLVDLLSVDVYS